MLGGAHFKLHQVFGVVAKDPYNWVPHYSIANGSYIDKCDSELVWPIGEEYLTDF